MKWLKRHISTLILSVIFVTGVGLIVYPTASDWINNMNQSQAIITYAKNVAEMDEEAYRRIMDSVAEYNVHLRTLSNRWNLNEEELKRYDLSLNIDGTGNMGYLSIPKIDVLLPIYHGTEEDVLQHAIGHIEGSSLPGGGEGTHCVVSGHRGLPGARLLTDLDKMRLGDTFTITILNEIFTYEVDQIRVVLPDEMNELEIDPEQDYVTLVTCTPYGINSHRLLVRGHRIPNAQGVQKADIRVTADGILAPVRMVLPVVALLMFILVFFSGLLLLRRTPALPPMKEVHKTLERLERMKRLYEAHGEMFDGY